MPDSTSVDPQESMLDATWDDPDLEAALEERETKREERLAAQGAFKIADDNAKALLVNYSLAVGEVARVGRFRIKKRAVAGNSVSFETQPREQLSIGVEDA